MEVTQRDIQDVKEKVAGMEQMLKNVYYAVVGNELLEDGGMVQQIKDCKERIAKLEDKLEIMESKNSKRDVYMSIMWAALGSTGGLILAYIFQLVTKKQ